jgi:hypothetical protein
MRPQLRSTGWQPPHPVLFCPVCKQGHFLHTANAWTGATDFTLAPVDGTEVKEWYETHKYDWR